MRGARPANKSACPRGRVTLQSDAATIPVGIAPFGVAVTPPPLYAALVLDRKKLAAFSAAAGRFLRFPIGDRRGTRMRASASKRPVTRAQVYKRDSSGVAPASPQVAYRALLERAGSREPADRGGVDGIGPRHIGLRLACSKALERFLALMGRHLARASEANAALLGALGGGFLRFPIGDRRCNRTRASVGNAGGNARPSLTNARQL